MEIFCIGSAVMDITGWPIDQTQSWKEKQRISEIRIQPGGDAVNQCAALASLCKNPVAMTGKQSPSPILASCVGADMNGRMLKSTLADLGVDVRYVKEKADCATGTAMVLVNQGGERRVFSVKGAHSTISREDLPWELPSECRAVSLASLFSMPVLEADGLLEYLQMVKSEKNRLVFADLAADKLGLGLKGIERFLPYIDYFLPSLYDVLEMTEAKSAPEAAKRFHELGVSHVLIKCGERGCYCSSPEYEGQIPALAVESVDTTGAGDCMSAVFASRILMGDGVEAAGRFACAAASYGTMFPGAWAGDLSVEKVHQLLKTEWKNSTKEE